MFDELPWAEGESRIEIGVFLDHSGFVMDSLLDLHDHLFRSKDNQLYSHASVRALNDAVETALRNIDMVVAQVVITARQREGMSTKIANPLACIDAALREHGPQK